MKKILFVLLVLAFTGKVKAQNITDPFFDRVDYVGAFNGTTDWTAGWTNWFPEDTDYAVGTVTKGNGLFTFATGLHITSDETWSGAILLDGWVYVDDAATLTISAGTVIRATGKSALIIQRGAKLLAVGTSSNPIVFTSNQDPGFRDNSDWAGLVICGKGVNNLAGGEGVTEGGTGAAYGGTDNADNSGVLKYLRIEFPGFEVATGSEVNGLSLYSVGSGTTIDYIQVSNSGDDGYEWFGGAVNAKHLISYRTEDDDFDTDNGYIGMVQFGVVARDSTIVDTDAANGFESDNDAAGSSNSPKTNALFSNISAFGPSADNNTPVALRTRHNEGSAMRLRRNTRLQIYNSLLMGYSNGLRIESEKGWASASSDSLTVQYSIMAGIRNEWFKTDVAAGASAIKDWYLDESRKNDTITLASSVLIGDPFNYAARNFQPQSGSAVFNKSYWYYHPVVTIPSDITNPFFDHVNYVGAFDVSSDWTTGWTNWKPEDAEYPATTVTKGNGIFDLVTGLHITASETWSGSILLDGWVYVDNGTTLTIEPGTVIRGTAKSALIIQRGGKIMAEGTSDSPIVFTSAQDAGFRENSDWAGLVICGRGVNNLAGGNGVAEGGVGAIYGGTDNEDNSGVLKYVRIEFPGFEVATGSEVNGLTLYSVGSATTIDYIQVSNSGDDAYEWFGGSVNAKHLISYRTEDDDFDTDNGYIGMVQFGLVARDSSIVDTDAANGFESDNDAAGSSNSPKTNALFSNISAFGPSANNTTPTALRPRHNEGSAMRLRRNTRLQIYNSLFMGYSNGLRIESEKGWASASSDSLTVQNTLIAGIRNDWFKTDVAAGPAAIKDWFLAEQRNNDTITLSSSVKIGDPFNYDSRNFKPMAGSPVLNASIWYEFVQPATVFEIISNSADHSTLETAIVAAELDDDLSGTGPFTVFAPTNAAFDALPAGALDALLADPTGDLANVLLYHVAGQKLMSGDLSNGQIITTLLLGDEVTVEINGNGVFVNGAKVTVSDLTAVNGVVHVIDAVLLPPVYPEYVFNVDMSDANLVGGDRVFIAGSFGRDINWVAPGDNTDLEMFDTDGDGIYSVTLNLQNGEVAFKFFKNVGWNGGEWAGDPNRTYTLAGSETLNYKWGINGIYINVKSNDINVSIYPNPVVDVLNVSLASPNAKVAIYNSLGVMIEKVTVQGTQARIDVSSYANGLYFVKVNNNTVVRFVK